MSDPPLTAAEVIMAMIDKNAYDVRAFHVDDALAALRAAAGGGDVVICPDGTLARLVQVGAINGATRVPMFRVVPLAPLPKETA